MGKGDSAVGCYWGLGPACKEASTIYRARRANARVGAKIISELKTAIVVSILSATVFLAGCFKRQTAPRLVYVPAPPAAPKPDLAQQGSVLVIQEPTPPPAAESVPKSEESEVTPPAPERLRKHKTVQAGAAESGAAPDTAVEPAASSAPALLPERSLQQQIDLEKQIGDLRGTVRQRIARLSRMTLSTEDRKAIQDARLFLTEADQSMRENDLQQALNLEQKADVLISAVENRH